MPANKFEHLQHASDADRLHLRLALPFGGFYHDPHTDRVDQEYEDMVDSAPALLSYDAKDELHDLYNEGMDWRGVYRDIAKAYAVWLLETMHEGSEVNLPADVNFTGEVVSPREYNFMTDTIWLNLPAGYLPSVNEINEVYDGFCDKVEQLVVERFSSYDGFISFQSNDPAAYPFDTRDYTNPHFATLVFELLCLEALGYDDVFDIEQLFIDDKAPNGFYSELFWEHNKNAKTIDSRLQETDF